MFDFRFSEAIYDLRFSEAIFDFRFSMFGGDFRFPIFDFEFKTIEPLIEKYIGSLSDLKRDDPYIDHGIRYIQKREYNEYKEED